MTTPITKTLRGSRGTLEDTTAENLGQNPASSQLAFGPDGFCGTNLHCKRLSWTRSGVLVLKSGGDHKNFEVTFCKKMSLANPPIPFLELTKDPIIFLEFKDAIFHVSF